MRTHVKLPRPATATARRVDRPTNRGVAVATSRAITVERRASPVAPPSPDRSGAEPDPYVDYGRVLTAEGGILILYKDIDKRLRHMIWRLFAWVMFTGLEGWLIFHHSPLHAPWIRCACLLGIAIANWLIVAKPVEVYRRIEIRSDCMILEGTDIFWLRHMEGGWPGFRADADGGKTLCGIYGTRFIEYLTIAPSTDENDRTIAVLADHLQNAMTQLWTRQ